MINATNPNTKIAILSILLEAKQCGIGKITRTALVKYVYLMDLWTAEETSGETFTGTEWRFHHFGPYSEALIMDLDWLSTQPSVNKEDVSGNNRDYSLYSLSEWAKAPTFEALGLVSDVRLKLIEAIKNYAGDLNSLLNFIYFRTTPMQGAIPGTVLSFSDAQKIKYKTDIKTVMVPINETKKIARIKFLLAQIGKQWEEGHRPRKIPNPPIRDALFKESESDDGLNDIDGNFRTSLSFREGSD
jgi:hypothetical protein